MPVSLPPEPASRARGISGIFLTQDSQGCPAGHSNWPFSSNPADGEEGDTGGGHTESSLSY